MTNSLPRLSVSFRYSRRKKAHLYSHVHVAVIRFLCILAAPGLSLTSERTVPTEIVRVPSQKLQKNAVTFPRPWQLFCPLVKVKIALEQAMKALKYTSTRSLTSTLDAAGRSTPRPGRFTPGKETRYSFYRGLGGP
jgi:hypothetical protein